VTGDAKRERDELESAQTAVDRRTGDDEKRVLHRLRVVSGSVVLGLIVLLVIADTLGRLFIRPDFRVGEIFLGTLVGALMLLIGIDVAARFPTKGNGK
jgi:hypothetical protein